MDHKYSQRVYFSDTDCQGIVYHAKYLDFAEHARTEMIRKSINQSKLLEDKVGFVLKEINVKYNIPAKLDDILDVYTSVDNMKLFSIILNQDIKREEELICSFKIKIALINFETNKILKVSDYFK